MTEDLEESVSLLCSQIRREWNSIQRKWLTPLYLNCRKKSCKRNILSPSGSLIEFSQIQSLSSRRNPVEQLFTRSIQLEILFPKFFFEINDEGDDKHVLWFCRFFHRLVVKNSTKSHQPEIEQFRLQYFPKYKLKIRDSSLLARIPHLLVCPRVVEKRKYIVLRQKFIHEESKNSGLFVEK